MNRRREIDKKNRPSTLFQRRIERTGRNFIIKDGLSGIEIAGSPGANARHDHEEAPIIDGIDTLIRWPWPQ